MSFDGIVTKSVVNELKETILGGRVDKIYQQEKDEILMYVHSKGTNYKLIISSSSNNSRVYLTDFSKKNPISPPMFCMLLRKHLLGGIILNVEQFNLDRVVFIDISAIDELGQPTEKRIIIEIMGKHSNTILVDKSSLKIIDSVKRVYEDMSRVRQILPGMIYEYPPLQNKINPLTSIKKEFFNLIESSDKDIPIFKFFYFNFVGLSPLISREICFDSNIDNNRRIGSLTEDDKDSLFLSFNKFISNVSENNYKPVSILSNDAEIFAFHTLDLNQFGPNNKVYYDSISRLLDNYYHRKDIIDRIGQRSQSIRKSIGVKLDRTLNKLGKQKEELLESEDREKYKIYADLISANLHRIPNTVDNIDLENFYDENMSILNIPLDIKLSPVLNAQKYYKRYSKLKNAHSLLQLEQIPETKNEISYLENILMSIENSTEVEELDEIKEELIKEGYIKGVIKKRKKNKEETVTKPHHYMSIDGFNIYVGKNNKQNDYLTLKLSHKEDIWMHVQNMPGSHVVIERSGKSVPDTTLEQAAILAAYYSKGKLSNHVPVDYTERKNVKKPKNAKLGMVIYNNFKTISVNPSKELVLNIKKVEK